MSNREATPRPFVLYAVLVSLLATGALLLSFPSRTPSAWPIVIVLAVAVVLSENFALELPGVGSTSLSYPLTIAGLVLAGPLAAGLIALFSGVNVRDLRSGRPLSVYLFNIGQLVLCATVAGWVYESFGGLTLYDSGISTPVSGAQMPAVLIAMGLCALLSALMNDLLVAVALRLKTGEPVSQVWARGLLWMVPTQLTLAVMGFTIAQVISINYLAFLLFVFPLLIARQAYQNHLSLRAAYSDSVRSLVNILEAKDPYTRGHSQRVAVYSSRIGQQMGLSDRELGQLERAALLHDIGKLDVPISVLGKPGGLDEDELRLVRGHPARGAELVARIPLLEGLGDVIRHHHERWDGCGYGDGLASTEAPLLSRILAVADAFDAMTTARPYRDAMSWEQARAEVLACSGTQFDPDIVEAFARVDLQTRLFTDSRRLSEQAPADGVLATGIEMP